MNSMSHEVSIPISQNMDMNILHKFLYFQEECIV